MQGRGSGKPEDSSCALAWPLDQGKPLEIKVKAPAASPRPGFRRAAHPPAAREQERKLLEKFLVKL